MTISDIKRLTEKKSPYFFSDDTLKFFGQTIHNFEVQEVRGRVFIYAPSYQNDRLMGYTFREFKHDDLLLVKEVETSGTNALGNIISYFDEIEIGECPDCQSPLEENGACSDVGNNNCQYQDGFG